MKKDHIQYAIIITLLLMLTVAGIQIYLNSEDKSKFQQERERLNTAIEEKTTEINNLKNGLKTISEKANSLQQLADSQVIMLASLKQQIAKAKSENRKKMDQFTDAQSDSAFQKLYPQPDSFIFSTGSKATYVVTVQKQAYSDIIAGYYWKDYAEKSDSTMNVFKKLVFQKDLLVAKQQKVIDAQDDKIDLLLQSQVNDLGEISKLRKMIRFKNLVISIGLPIVGVGGIIGGIYLGSQIK